MPFSDESDHGGTLPSAALPTEHRRRLESRGSLLRHPPPQAPATTWFGRHLKPVLTAWFVYEIGFDIR